MAMPLNRQLVKADSHESRSHGRVHSESSGQPGESELKENEKSGTSPLIADRERRGKELSKREGRLGKLAAEQKKEEFFQQITPLLQSLKAYIKRRLRVAYLTLQIRKPVYTSNDIVDEVILKAYDNYGQKPKALTLEEWLYQLANERLERYFRKRKATEAQASLESLEQSELRTLEEIPFTADADGEPWFPEDLDDSEIPEPDFTQPVSENDPEKQLERKEEVQRMLRALSGVPEQDRIVFELFAVEGFPKEVVARIVKMSPTDVRRIAERVRDRVRREIKAAAGEATTSARTNKRETRQTVKSSSSE
jgi:RNA polymerase sigma factor (sigma-70 family)